MSANLLQNPGKMHIFTDDLESFLHVLGWMTLRYVPAIDSYSALRRGKDMVIFDEHDEEEDHSEHGGHDKARAFRAEDYPSPLFRPRHETPLFKLLQELRMPFKSLYGEPPTAEDRKNAEYLPSMSRKSQMRLCAISRYDEDIQCLQSSAWFIDTMKTALDENAWPADDRADENLPIGFSRTTQRQAQNRTNQLQHTHSLWENSKALSQSSKRAASPTPESSSKRRRGTPAASGTQN